MLEHFGEKLRYLRQKHAITQDQLAERLGLVTQGQVSLLERGLRQPSLDVVLHLSSILQISTDYLVLDPIPMELDAAYRFTTQQSLTLPLRQFGMKLRYLRRIRHMTQVDLALQIAPYTQAHISQLERGVSAPSIELVLEIAQLFAVSTDYLLLDNLPVEYPRRRQILTQ